MGEAVPAREITGEKEGCHYDLGGERDPDDAFTTIFFQEQAVELTQADEGNGQEGEDPAIGLFVDVKDVHEDDGGSGDIGKESGEGKGFYEHVYEELRFADDGDKVIDDGSGFQGKIPVGRVAFREEEDGQQGDEGTEDQQDEEDRTPAEVDNDISSGCGGDHGGCSQYEQEQGKDLCAFFWLEEVAYHCHGGYLCGAASYGLDEPEYDEGVDVFCQHAKYGSCQIEGQTDVEGLFPAIAVQQGAV